MNHAANTIWENLKDQSTGKEVVSISYNRADGYHTVEWLTDLSFDKAPEIFQEIFSFQNAEAGSLSVGLAHRFAARNAGEDPYKPLIVKRGQVFSDVLLADEETRHGDLRTLSLWTPQSDISIVCNPDLFPLTINVGIEPGENFQPLIEFVLSKARAVNEESQPVEAREWILKTAPALAARPMEIDAPAEDPEVEDLSVEVFDRDDPQLNMS